MKPAAEVGSAVAFRAVLDDIVQDLGEMAPMRRENEQILDTLEEHKAFKELHWKLAHINPGWLCLRDSTIDDVCDSAEENIRAVDKQIQNAEALVAAYDACGLTMPLADAKVASIKKEISDYVLNIPRFTVESYARLKAAQGDEAYNAARCFVACCEIGARYDVETLWWQASKLKKARGIVAEHEEKMAAEVGAREKTLRKQLAELRGAIESGGVERLRGFKPLDSEYGKFSSLKVLCTEYNTSYLQGVEYVRRYDEAEAKRTREVAEAGARRKREIEETRLRERTLRLEEERVRLEQLRASYKGYGKIFSLPAYVLALGVTNNNELYALRSIILGDHEKAWVERLSHLTERMGGMKPLTTYEDLDYAKQLQVGLEIGMQSGSLATEMRTQRGREVARGALDALGAYIAKSEDATASLPSARAAQSTADMPVQSFH